MANAFGKISKIQLCIPFEQIGFPENSAAYLINIQNHQVY